MISNISAMLVIVQTMKRNQIEYQDVSVMKKSSYFNQNEIQVVSDETLKM
jgi:hypothetical protein